MKTEQDLDPAKKSAYLKAISALEMRNHGFVIELMGKIVAEEPEFLAGRKLLREAEVMRAGAGKSSFLGLSSGGLSLGKSKSQRTLESGDCLAAMNEAEKALETDPRGVQPNKDLHAAAEAEAAKARATFEKLREKVENSTGDEKANAEKELPAVTERMRSFEAIARFALETLALDGRDKAKQGAARRAVGYYLMSIQEYHEASVVFEDILKNNPTDTDARDKAKEAAARRSMKSGKYGQATFGDLVKQREQSEKEAGGKVATAADSSEELARRIYEAHEAGTPDREAARKLADLYYNAEDYENALSYFRYLSDLAEGTDPGLLRKISDTEVRRLSRSIADKQKQLESLAGDDPAAAALRAEIEEMRRGKAEQTLGEARKRVERNPTDLQYRFELGEQLVLAGYYKEAIPELQKARTNPNTRTRALNMLGKCYTERNMLDLAAKTLTDAASEIPGMDGTKKDITYNLGLVYERMGNAEKSLECMKQIYEVDYGYLDVAERVEASYTV